MFNVELANIKKNKNLQSYNQEEDLLDILRNTPCQILKTGFCPVQAKFLFCSCDPEMKNPICEECLQCHKDHYAIGTQMITAICSCGSMCHNIQKEIVSNNDSYVQSCFFHEMSQISGSKIYYEAPKDYSNTIDNIICIFCYNFCTGENSSYYGKKIFNSGGNNTSNNNFPSCNCRHSNHSNPKSIYELLIKISEESVLNNLSFEQLTYTHILNSIFLSSKSFKNLYQGFLNTLDYITTNINKTNESELLLQDMNFDLALESITKLILRCKRFLYLSEIIHPHIPDSNTLIQIILKKFDNVNNEFMVWKIKLNLVTIFIKLSLKRYFTVSVPAYKIYDFENMNPFQRLLIVKEVQEAYKSNSNYSKNTLESFLHVIVKLNKSKDKQIETYQLIYKCYQVIKFFAKFSMFNSELINKFCQINDELIFRFPETKILDKRQSSNILTTQIQILLPMIKSLRYFIYHYNDQCLEEFINDKSVSDKISTEKIVLYHSFSDIGRCISKNALNVLTFLRQLYNVRFNIELNNVILMQTNKILSHTTKIISMSINYPDYYSGGLQNIFDPSKELYIRYLSKIFDEKEKICYEFIKSLTKDMEDLYKNYFEFKTTEEIMIEVTKRNINTFFDKMMFKAYIPAFSAELNEDFMHLTNISNNNDEFIIIDHNEAGEATEKGKKYIVINQNASHKDNRYIQVNKFRTMLNNTNYIYLMIKIIKILHFRNSLTHKSQFDGNFILDEVLFENIYKVICFYIEKSPENCICLLNSDFIEVYNLLQGMQLMKMMDILEYMIISLMRIKYEFSSNYVLIYAIEIIVEKCSGASDSSVSILIHRVIKLIGYITQLIFIDQDHTNDELRRIVKMYHDNTIFKELKRCLIEQSLSNPSDRADIYQQFSVSSSLLGTLNQIDLSHMKKIVIKFLEIVNLLFDGDTKLNDKDFLKMILLPEEVPHILKNKELELELRTEILRFYRIMYIDVVINTDYKKSYIEVITNPLKTHPEDEEEAIKGNEILKLFKELILIDREKGDNNSSNSCKDKQTHYPSISLDTSIMKFELKFALEFIEKSKNSNPEVIINYFENGIIMPLIVLLNIFMSNLSRIDVSTGMILYELVYYFLRIKEYIIKNLDLFKNKNSNIKNLLRNFKIKTQIFKNYLTIYTNKISMINLAFKDSGRELADVTNDLEEMSRENFDLLDLNKLFTIFQKHVASLMNLRKSKSLKELFIKSDQYYPDYKIEKMRNFCTTVGLLNTEYQLKIFKFVVHYINTKNRMSDNSFIKVLDEENLHFSMKYRQLLVRSILFLISDIKSSQPYQKTSLWSLFRLLQYETKSFQDSVIELYESESDLLKIKKLANLFFTNLVSVLFTAFNPFLITTINSNYLSALTIIKIFKYLCEEHNKGFQKIFFQEILFNYTKNQENENSRLSKEKHNIENKNTFSSLISPREQIEKSKYDESLENTQAIDNHNRHLGIEHLNTPHSEILAKTPREKKSKIILFDFLLTITGKIVFIAQWEKVESNNNKEAISQGEADRNKYTSVSSSYYYDMFFVIIEFLIEMIQGTERSNLEILLSKEDHQESKHLMEFLNTVKPILFNDKNNSEVLYRVRKDIMDFLMAFLEEKSTPKNLVILMSNIIHPNTVVSSIVNVMKKLYLKITHTYDKVKQITLNDIEFDYTMYEFFCGSYFGDTELSEIEEFQLANRMYQYLKLLATNEHYAHEDAISIIDNVMECSESNFLNYYAQHLKKFQTNQNDFLVMSEVSYDDNFYKNYFCVKFFERITRIVSVQLEESEPIQVIFTLNPQIIHLTDNSKKDFYNFVNREGRYIKLFSLMEISDQFYDEIKFNAERSNSLLFLLNKLNTFYVEAFTFSLTLLINAYMIGVYDEEDLKEGGDTLHTPKIRYIAITNLIINCLMIIIWFYVKFKPSYIIEYKKVNFWKNGEKLNIWDYTKVFFGALFRRNDLLPFLWNAFFCSIGLALFKYNFVYAPQLFIIINLSQTMRNIFLSVTMKWKQLFYTFIFMLLICYIFSSIAFFYFSGDFIYNIFYYDKIAKVNHPKYAENFCRTPVSCWIMHMDIGVRTDGGIGEFLNKRHSLTYSPQYYIGRFFYEDISFIFVNFIMLSMVYGVIIDAFAELRDQSIRDDYDKLNVCFVCGATKEELEKKSFNFNDHIKYVHNMWTYVDYIIGLKFVDKQETNAINSYVIEQVENKQIAWFPAAEGDKGGLEEKENGSSHS